MINRKKKYLSSAINRLVYVTFFLGSMYFCHPLRAQINPIQLSTQLVPPYSVYLPDYASPGKEKLKLILLQRDLSKPSYQLQLSLSISLNGSVIMRTAPNFRPSPINVIPGIPVVISGMELQPYLESRNLDFVGYSREQYEKSKALPEGSYEICFTAFDYSRRDVIVSNVACSFYWLAKNEPPLINYPACGSAINAQSPQQVVFSWLPRNTSSPNSAAETEYEFSLFEVYDPGRDPNEIVVSQAPIFSRRTAKTQLVYGISDPLFNVGMTYVWRVQAIDLNGRDVFQNNGFSEACSFVYGSQNSTEISAVEGLQAEGETERRARVWWQATEADSYRIHYKKSGSDHRWFTSDVTEYATKIYELEPDTDYEVRVQAKLNSTFGAYSDIVSFSTPEPKTYVCGEDLPGVPVDVDPLPFATKGMIINVQDLELLLSEVTHTGEAGWYSGKGDVSIPYFGGASFRAKFDRLLIDKDRNAAGGRIDIISKGVDAYVEEELEKQRKEELEEQQRKNRERWQDTIFYEEIIYYKEIGIDSMKFDKNGNVVIYGPEGSTYINTTVPALLINAPEQAIIIEDKNGDQWVVQSDGRISEVPGGGLSPTGNVQVSEEALDIITQVLIKFSTQYTEAELQKIKVELDARRKVLDEYIEQHNSEVLNSYVNGSPEVYDDSESLLFDFVEIGSTQPGETEFERLSRSAKEKELEHNRGILLRLLSLPDNLEGSSEIIARELKIEDNTVSDYIKAQRLAGTSESDLSSAVEGAIIKLINKILTGSE